MKRKNEETNKKYELVGKLMDMASYLDDTAKLDFIDETIGLEYVDEKLAEMLEEMDSERLEELFEEYKDRVEEYENKK